VRALGWLLIVLLPQGARASPPSWAVTDSERVVGHFYRAACSGEGPSVGLARQEAIDSCRVSAAQYLPSEIAVKSVSVTSESDEAYHQEVSHRASISGLVCDPKHEKIEETDAKVKVWVLCEFDLSRARAVPKSLEELLAARPKAGSADRRVLTLAVVPLCSSLIVSGRSPARIVRCDRNPVSLLLEPGDSEVLVRAKGRIPKTLLIPPKEGREYARVVLDPAG
jgi:hypothetical protein